MIAYKIKKYLQFTESVRAIVDFYYECEKAHFECSKSKNHIFKHFKIAKDFLDVPLTPQEIDNF